MDPLTGTAAKQRGSTKRGSRGRGGGAGGKSASPEDSPAELSSDCSSSLKVRLSPLAEQDIATMPASVAAGCTLLLLAFCLAVEVLDFHLVSPHSLEVAEECHHCKLVARHASAAMPGR